MYVWRATHGDLGLSSKSRDRGEYMRHGDIVHASTERELLPVPTSARGLSESVEFVSISAEYSDC